MCGLFCYTGRREAIPVLVGGLYKLEYRGYDSAGIATIRDNRLDLVKVTGKIFDLDRAISNAKIAYTGIGHCRWASHGIVTRANAHPFGGCTKNYAIAHNGIIENFKEIKDELNKKSHYFESETDSEVVVHMLEEGRGTFLDKVIKTVNQLTGAFALAMVNTQTPDTIIAVKKGSPLIIGFGDRENLISSDIPALSKYTNKVYHMKDNEIAVVTKTDVKVYDFNGREQPITTTDCSEQDNSTDLNGYESYMLKEINEQPEACQRLISSCLEIDQARNKEMVYSKLPIFNDNLYNFIGCGSAYYAALFTANSINEFTKYTAFATVSSEFNSYYAEDFLHTVFSQSGSTYDTLEVCKRLRGMARPLCGIINTEQSAIEKECLDGVLHLKCGPEISVASTKAFTSMALAGAIFTKELADRYFVEDLKKFPDAVREALKTEEQVKRLIRMLFSLETDFDSPAFENPIFIGKGPGYAIALEGALKLKEISYFPAQAIPSGELKHGPLSLVTQNSPVFAVIPEDFHFAKNLNAIAEVKARGGFVTAITNSNEHIPADFIIKVPDVNKILNPILCLIPLQFLAYHMARKFGRDLDKPRNLSKSITVG